jgi:NADPH:quinone reductase-like Zn-dependent oxidoreductase
MKAIRIHQYGELDTLIYEDAPLPEIAADDVLIKVCAAGVNPVDWKIRQGHLQTMIPYDFPLILGWDVSGVVEAVGDQVSTFKVGDEVYSRPDIARDGTYAEFVAIKASELAFKPKTIDHIHAAGIPLTGLTAYQALFTLADLKAGQTVLIHAAAGGVGSLAVQMAKIKGAHVIGTASAKNKDFVLGLGADTFIDYQSEQFETILSDVDVVFDTVGGDTQDKSWQVLKKGGILVSIVAPPPPEKAKEHHVRSEFLFIEPNAAQLTEIAQWIDAGKLVNHIEKVFPLQDAALAHELSQTGKVRGKLVLQVTK